MCAYRDRVAKAIAKARQGEYERGCVGVRADFARLLQHQPPIEAIKLIDVLRMIDAHREHGPAQGTEERPRPPKTEKGGPDV
ncbi:hypothetical protein LCGC14_1438200 [marine sediment metagenome]|uniref:Uncharacterized protein n=1 Tax=marine sediment metagenome TaxID=412755 RepID=A0A0F9MNB4_9ZZZZ